MDRYQNAKLEHQKLGVDTESAINQLKEIHISIHCW